MSKMSSDLTRHPLSGETMGTRWSALFFDDPHRSPAPVQAALQSAVQAVDDQMSTWKADSDLMQLNRAPVGQWQTVPLDLTRVLTLGLAIGRASGGAFDIGVGDVVRAWGFGPEAADPQAISAAIQTTRQPAHERLQIDGDRVRKTAPLDITLNGIAKGHALDRMADVLRDHGIRDALVGIDGEMRAMGLRPDGTPWMIAIEAPEYDRRSTRSILGLHDAAVATSGDYRHWVTVRGHRLSHTMDPATAAPLARSPASVTVVAATCAEADAWATALMVAGPDRGALLATQFGLDALFLLRRKDLSVQSRAVGRLFGATG